MIKDKESALNRALFVLITVKYFQIQAQELLAKLAICFCFYTKASSPGLQYKSMSRCQK